MKYVIRITEQANKDIRSITGYLKNECFAPLTAERFVREIYGRIESLRLNAGIYAVSTYRDVLIYDANARHITYKGFAIIYTIHGKTVLIHRIIHGSAFKE